MRVLHAKPNILETNSITAELVTTLTVCIFIEGRDILPDIFRNEDITKGVLIGMTHVEPRSMHALNETTFLVTYPWGILAEDISSTKIMQVAQLCKGHQVPHFLTKQQAYHNFLALNARRTL